jgi:signal transduction histidine kinase
MDGKGALTVQPARQSRVVAMLAGVWVAIILVLIFWWASIVMRQARRIADLSLAAGESQSDAATYLQDTQRMVLWEGGTFVVLLLTLSVALFWFYWRDLLRARGTQAFFAALTHELRTPLTSVRLQTEAIAEGEPTPELIERLLADTHRLESQIDKTLELARLEGGGKLADQAIRLDPWLNRVIGSIVSSQGEPVDLDVVVEGELPAISGDTSALQLILRNLVENSLRHGDVAVPRVEVLARRSRGGGVELRYRDNGRGSSEDPAKLGELFQRGGKSTGAGVGLYLIRVLMDRMGGGVTFAHAEQGGFEARLHFQPSAA